ncbi:MAG: hypothetical protein VX835_03765 [Pseudomonadota bacterium]|nr:hypothetical protein [Pseudomonadota bacterium]
MLVEYSIKRLNDAVRLTGNLIFQVFIFAVEFIVNKIRLILHFAFCCVSILLALFVKLLSVPNTLGDLMLKRKRYVFKSSYAFLGLLNIVSFFICLVDRFIDLIAWVIFTPIAFVTTTFMNLFGLLNNTMRELKSLLLMGFDSYLKSFDLHMSELTSRSHLLKNVKFFQMNLSKKVSAYMNDLALYYRFNVKKTNYVKVEKIIQSILSFVEYIMDSYLNPFFSWLSISLSSNFLSMILSDLRSDFNFGPKNGIFQNLFRVFRDFLIINVYVVISFIHITFITPEFASRNFFQTREDLEGTSSFSQLFSCIIPLNFIAIVLKFVIRLFEFLFISINKIFSTPYEKYEIIKKAYHISSEHIVAKDDLKLTQVDNDNRLPKNPTDSTKTV